MPKAVKDIRSHGPWLLKKFELLRGGLGKGKKNNMRLRVFRCIKLRLSLLKSVYAGGVW